MEGEVGRAKMPGPAGPPGIAAPTRDQHGRRELYWLTFSIQ